MPSERVITIHAPLGGIRRTTAFQDTATYSCYDSYGFWPIDAKTGQERCAIQPGWTSFQSLSNANLISTLDVAPTDSTTYLRLLLVAHGGTLYKSTGGSFSSVGSIVATTRNVQACSYGKKLFIADNTIAKVYTDGGSVADYVATGGKGTVPANCLLICEWGGRIVMGGDPANPHILNFSRVDDPFDWLFAADDTGSACASTDISGGQIQEPATALIPHNRACLIVGSANNLYIYRGNPTDGGQLEILAHAAGVVNATAWCKTSPDDWTYILTTDGLYRMAPGCGSIPTSVSREKIADTSLLTIDGINRKAYLAYDVRYRGIHIYVTGSPNEHWWFDIKHEGFWKMQLPGTGVLAIGNFDPLRSTSDLSSVLVGTSSGLRRLDRTVAFGGSTVAYLQIGPFKLSTASGMKSLIRRAVPVLGGNTNDTTGTLDFYAAGSAEAVTALPVSRKDSKTLAQCAYDLYPRVGGQAGMLVLTQTDTSKHISFEETTIYAESFGQERG